MRVIPKILRNHLKIKKYKFPETVIQCIFFSYRCNMEFHGIIRLRHFADLFFLSKTDTEILALLTITYSKWTDHPGCRPETISEVANGNDKIGRKRERSKGPVLPVVKDVGRVHPFSLPFESSGSQLGTVRSPHLKCDLLP